jgi:hypothetical protein
LYFMFIEAINCSSDFFLYYILYFCFSPVFCINWKFEIDQCYRARPKLTLGMKVPSYSKF